MPSHTVLTVSQPQQFPYQLAKLYYSKTYSDGSVLVERKNGKRFPQLQLKYGLEGVGPVCSKYDYVDP